MKIEWLFKPTPFDSLKVELETLSEQGWDIFSVLPVINSHAGIVARKQPPLDKIVQPPLTGSNQKKGRR